MDDIYEITGGGKMTNITIKTKGMHCSSCEMLVVDSLEELDGVMGATASHKEETVSVNYDDSKVELAQIKSVIKSEGFEVE